MGGNVAWCRHTSRYNLCLLSEAVYFCLWRSCVISHYSSFIRLTLHEFTTFDIAEMTPFLSSQLLTECRVYLFISEWTCLLNMLRPVSARDLNCEWDLRNHFFIHSVASHSISLGHHNIWTEFLGWNSSLYAIVEQRKKRNGTENKMFLLFFYSTINVPYSSLEQVNELSVLINDFIFIVGGNVCGTIIVYLDLQLFFYFISLCQTLLYNFINKVTINLLKLDYWL